MSHFRFSLWFLKAAVKLEVLGKKITWWLCSLTWKDLRATASLTFGIHKMAAVGVAKQNYQTTALLQRALGAAATHSSLHFLGVWGAVGAAENHLPPPALGDATANARGCCCLAGSGTIHARDLGGRCACSQWLVALQLLPHYLALTRELWT